MQSIKHKQMEKKKKKPNITHKNWIKLIIFISLWVLSTQQILLAQRAETVTNAIVLNTMTATAASLVAIKNYCSTTTENRGRNP